ncbi:MAG: hypothetical protein ABIR70_04220 [Bryobacteraceae bacterium]
MDRFRQLCLMFVLMASLAWAQRQMSIAQLEQFIKSSIDLKHPDKQVADVVRTLKLSERLTASAIEDLQGKGAGPRTVEALKLLIAGSASLPVPAPPVTLAAIISEPPPPDAQLREILKEVTQNSLDYTKGLPNFICTQVTRRYVDGYGNGGFQLADTIQEQLSFVDGHENYKVVLVNNLAVNNIGHDQLGGTTSSGEFGTMLAEIFSPKASADIKWERWGTLRNRKTYVFAFRILQRNSEYRISDQSSGRSMIAGYHGLLYADVESKMVMRIKMDLDGLEDFPIQRVSLDLNYDFVDISGNKFVLPLKAELTSQAGRFSTRNDVEFRRYERFSADAKIIFDVPDELPKDQLEETPLLPPQPAAPAKKP